MNNETQLDATALITPEILQAVKNLQREGYVPMLIRHLEEMLDFFIDTDLDTSQRLDYIQILRSTQKSLKPFAVSEWTIDEEKQKFALGLQQCKIRQEITEPFISWADEFFPNDEKFDVRLSGKELYEAFCNYDPMQGKFISPTMFKKKFMQYCLFKVSVFNPHQYEYLMQCYHALCEEYFTDPEKFTSTTT
ncbi:hypothetical protein EZS27_037294 [termite gut metagenome]|uniref:Uncharacterized protein n=1 Tax=termite gut metagenome TaxID=433724 RepID=A0A5J4PR08_9ZZZZ